MGSVVFQGASGGQTNLTGSDSAVTNVLTVPAANGYLVITDSTNQAILVPTGTTAQRPATPINGM